MPLPDIDSLDTYGGIKINYSEVEDPDTDLSADASNKSRVSIAAMTNTACRAIITFTHNGTTATVTNVIASYVHSAPYTPTIAKLSTGQWGITMPASVVDELGETHFINIRKAHGNASTGLFCHIQCVRFSVNQVIVYTFDAAGTQTDFVSTPFEIFIY